MFDLFEFRKNISDEHKKLLNKYAEEQPINLEQLINELDFELIYYDFDKFEENENLKNIATASGILIPSSDKHKTTILVNKNEYSRRMRFTIAHEIGHYFLHKFEERVSFRHKKTPEELEADEFAANLLMPANLVEEEYEKNKSKEREEVVRILADHFEVSAPAMEYRLDNLKLK